MWGALFSLLCLVYIIYSSVKEYFNRKKKQNIHSFLKKGIFCYKCKDLMTENILEVSKKLDIQEDNYHMCTKCQRENKLSELLSKNFINKNLNKIKNLNWSSIRVLQFSWIIWGFGISLLLIGSFSDYDFLKLLSTPMHAIQIYLLNRHFNSQYEDPIKTSEKLLKLK